MTTEQRIAQLERVVVAQQKELSLARQVLQSHAEALRILAEHAGATFEQQPAQGAPLSMN